MKLSLLSRYGCCSRFMVLISALGLFFMLEGCCEPYCIIFGDANNCKDYCSDEELAWRIRNNDYRDSVDAAKSSAPTIPPPIPGEMFALSITLGSTLNFKSSEDSYGGSYGTHEPGIGFNLGVGTLIPFNKHWGIAPSLNFTQMNASEKLDYSIPGGTNMEFTDKYSYNYLGARFLGQYRAGKRLSFVAGPEVNYLLGASVKNSGSSGSGEKQSITSSSQKLGFDLLAGVKYEIPAGNKRSRLGLQLMYNHRLSRLNEKQDVNGYDVPAYHMKGFELGLSYFICGCGKKK
jgi:opacity protein-like surface antigen